MKLIQTFITAFILLFSIAEVLAQESSLIGEAAFNRACSSCHVSLEPGTTNLENARIPFIEDLRSLSANSIFTSLNSGKMTAQAEGLPEQERLAIAEFLSGETSISPAANNFSSSLCENSADFPSTANQMAWNGWGVNLSNTRFQTAQTARLSPQQIPNLELAWAFGFADALAARTQPTVIDSWLYTAGGNGDVFALDAISGCIHWVYKAEAAVRTAMTVTKSLNGELLVYFGDGQANAYALNAQTGEPIWKQKIDSHPNATITGAPTVYKGTVYIPTSAAGEEVRGPNPDYACCTFRGSISALNADTGQLRWKTYSIAETPKPRGLSANGVQLFGPAGAGIWNAPTIDPDRNLLYVGTGNGFADPAQATSDAILALNMTSGDIEWVSQTLPNDVWLWQCDTYNAGSPNCPENQGPDFDFATSPILLTTPLGRELLIVPQKSGMVYAMDPNAKGKVVWQYRIGEGSPLGGQWGGASDGHNFYIGVADTLTPAPGGVHAINLDTGRQTWFAPPRPTLCAGGINESCFAAQGGAISAIPGAIFSGGSDGGIRAYSTTDGELIWEYDTNREFKTVNNVIANGASMDASGPVIVNGMVYVNSGYNGIVGRGGNVLLAFRLPQ